MIVDGINVVRELVKACVKIDKIVVEENENSEIIEIVDRARSIGVKVEILTKKDFEKKIKFKNQGIVAYVPDYKYCDVDDILLIAERKNHMEEIVMYLWSYLWNVFNFRNRGKCRS